MKSYEEGSVVNLVGKYGICEFYQFLHAECAFMISVDSAPLHIARKWGLPTLSVWGPTNPLNYMDIPEAESRRHRYHYLGVHCSPCIHHTLVLPCGGDNFCMKDMDANHLTSFTQQMIHELQTPAHVQREA